MRNVSPQYRDAVAQQEAAANPKHSPLVSANAGSGKTHVLVSRVSRLLLEQVPPEKILCLTYTKAAASEMQTRLFETLGEWSVVEADILNASLNRLLGTQINRDQRELGKARKLFAKALETPEGLKVQTIHAFCDRLLSRFPIEAGILPGFEAIDERRIAELSAEVEGDLNQQAWENPQSDLANAFRVLSSDKTDSALTDVFSWMSGNITAIEKWQSIGLDPLIALLNVDVGTEPDDIIKHAWELTDIDDLKHVTELLRESDKPSDHKVIAKVENALNAPDALSALEHYASVFLTRSGTFAKSVVTTNVPEICKIFFGRGDLVPTTEAQRISEAFNRATGAKCLRQTHAVYTLAVAFAKRYRAAKLSRRWLDFNDQVDKVRALLLRSEVSEWVRYKLDGGISHILVDEAQDTAPPQWDIIDILNEGLSDGSIDVPKTFFAVGDEKQSIYSFQGARPEIFLAKVQDHIRDNPREAVKMSMSFRSCAEVLDVVDQVLLTDGGQNRMFNPEALAQDLLAVKHVSNRSDHGQVELWPLVPPPDKPPEENPLVFERPVDAPDPSSSKERLAGHMATQIRQWITHKEPVFDRELGASRPMHAGDILILVKGRKGGFYDAVIRHLKLAQIPVAGADRLVLSESVIVQDLLALTRFVLLPRNDLALAEVLKGPLFGLSETALFDLAHPRKGHLWSALRQSQTPLGQTYFARLSQYILWAETLTPYDFYKQVLEQISEDGPSQAQSGYKRLFRRLGTEARDALDAFLDLAMTHQQSEAPSLQMFLQTMSDDSSDVKRDMEASSGEVRIMTVHGAKGLESPVVFLPQTTYFTAKAPQHGLYDLGLRHSGGFAYMPNTASTPAILAPISEAEKQREAEEYMRLLYVAMTRAESRLIVCGYHSGHANGSGYSKGSWYETLSTAFDGLEVSTRELPFGTAYIYGEGAEPATANTKVVASKAADLPDWVNQAAPRETEGPKTLSPSNLITPPETYAAPARSPLSLTPDRFKRGNIIHKLLEILPETAVDRREDIARAFLSRHADVTKIQAQALYAEVVSVLDNPNFAELFGPNSEAEVTLAGHVDTLPGRPFISGQVDRLVISDQYVHIVDFKSNRPPPTTASDIADIYVAQMAAYRAMLKDMYPNHSIRCSLLWTDGPNLMTVPDKAMDTILTRLPVIPT